MRGQRAADDTSTRALLETTEVAKVCRGGFAPPHFSGERQQFRQEHLLHDTNQEQCWKGLERCGAQSTLAKNVAMSAFFSSEVFDEESSEQDDSCDLDPSENFHTHVIRSDRQQRRRAKVRSVQKVDKQKFDNASSEEDILSSSAASSATSFWARGISAASCRSRADRDSSCHSHAASPTTVANDLTSDPLTDEIAPTMDAYQQSSSSESHVRSA